MKLPPEFIERMGSELELLGIPRDGFFESFDRPGLKGIRLNLAKIPFESMDDIISAIDADSSAERVPWCDGGFYTSEESVGNSPFYHAGIFYPQEPSAMLPAQVLSASPGDIVIDLCAAPGGKTCRIAEDMKGKGLLIANEISESRSRALLRNIERMGITNCVITNEDPLNLRKNFKGLADKIIVDAPCSGEGMFRRDPSAVKSWERYGPSECASLQRSILESADIMLRNGGELVYSTCTFGLSEDEIQIRSFISAHPEYEVIPHPGISGVTHAGKDSPLPGSMRIWPHLSGGDGHFCVHLKKRGSSDIGRPESLKPVKPGKSSEEKKAFLGFLERLLLPDEFRCLEDRIRDMILIRDSHIIIPCADFKFLKEIKVVKNGIYAGEIRKKGRNITFVPSHSLALSILPGMLNPDILVNYDHDDRDLLRYLKGETLFSESGRKGYVAVAVKGYPIGFGKKTDDGNIKNLYPKAWRIL